MFAFVLFNDGVLLIKGPFDGSPRWATPENSDYNLVSILGLGVAQY